MTNVADGNGWVLARLDALRDLIQDGGTKVDSLDEEWTADGILRITVQVRRKELQG
jgi:hypothetical protein